MRWGALVPAAVNVPPAPGRMMRSSYSAPTSAERTDHEVIVPSAGAVRVSPPAATW